MIDTGLYDKALIDPVSQQAAHVCYIVSGYASAGFASRHLQQVDEMSTDWRLHLLVGMPSEKSKGHEVKQFKRLVDKYEGRFSCHYYQGLPKVHSKRSRDRYQQPHPNSGCGHINGGRSLTLGKSISKYRPFFETRH